jgi:Ca2+-binding EF-hand superfamily protein
VLLRLKSIYRALPEEDLEQLLEGNEITGFDPVLEAFKVYDPEGTGYADVDIMRQVFEGLGYADLTGDDLEVLVEVADHDNDGLISLQDFRDMVDKRTAAPAPGQQIDLLG